MSALAAHVVCRYCSRSIVLASCADGRRRTFDPDDQVGPAPSGVWVWLRGRGMTEVPDHRGHRLHWCSQFHRARPADLDLGDPRAR